MRIGLRKWSNQTREKLHKHRVSMLLQIDLGGVNVSDVLGGLLVLAGDVLDGSDPDSFHDSCNDLMVICASVICTDCNDLIMMPPGERLSFIERCWNAGQDWPDQPFDSSVRDLFHLTRCHVALCPDGEPVECLTSDCACGNG
jgi:hypothetical protein